MSLRIPGKTNFRPKSRPGPKRPSISGSSQPAISASGSTPAVPSTTPETQPTDAPASSPFGLPPSVGLSSAPPPVLPSVPAPVFKTPALPDSQTQPPASVSIPGLSPTVAASEPSPTPALSSVPPRVARAPSVTSSRASTGKSLLVAAAAASLTSAAKQSLTGSTAASPRRSSVVNSSPTHTNSSSGFPPLVQASPSQSYEASFGLPPMVSSSAVPPTPDTPSSLLPPTVGAIQVDGSEIAFALATVEQPSDDATAVGETSMTLEEGLHAGDDDDEQPTQARRKRGRPKMAARVEVLKNKRLRRKTQQSQATPVDSTAEGEEVLPPGEEAIEGQVNSLESPRRRRIGASTRNRTGPRTSASRESSIARANPKAGTTAEERQRMVRQRERISSGPRHPELEGVEPEDMVGDEIDPQTIQMKDLATTRMSEGKVSARAIKLHEFHRQQEEQKKRIRAEKAEHLWKQRQLIRRRARTERNSRRARKRDEAAQGQFEGEISEDSEDSEEDFEPIPDRLTPPGSPEPEQRIAPTRIEPLPAVAEGEEGDENREENAGEEGEEGEEYEGEPHIYGDGYWQGEGEDGGEGERLPEDFQLPMEEGEEGAGEGNEYPPDVADYSNMEADEHYTGGFFDEDGNWVQGHSNVELLRYRMEERRREIEEGNDDREVEVVDSDVQFVNSSTFAKKVSTDRWTKAETEVFFEVLRETGENYTLMKAYFPGRTAKQLKRKGIRENRDNPVRMNDAIFNRKPIDKTYLAKSAGFDVEAPFDKERLFLQEVAEEKERIKRLDTEAAEAAVAAAAEEAGGEGQIVPDGDGEGQEYDYGEGDGEEGMGDEKDDEEIDDKGDDDDDDE